MSEYINRKILVDLVLSKLRFMGDARIMNKNDEKVLSEIDGYEKAIYAVHELLLDKDLIEDIQPICRGQWEEIEDYDGDTHYGCTACGAEFYLEAGTPEDNEYYYCPKCGARMDGDEE